MEKKERPKIKCLVWDLDNTIWSGVLLEDIEVYLRNDIADTIKEIDSRGILQSIASKNEYDTAMLKLKEFGIDEYFIYPQIGWNPKSASVKSISQAINIGTDTLAFIDDQQFELDEVKFSLPEVLCIDSAKLDGLLGMPELNPRFVTKDSRLRRSMYISDIKRNKVEESFEGTQEEFLKSLNMVFTISPVGDGDLQRAEELTVRTHQLNATGYTYSYEELDSFRKSDKHKLFIASLEDKYGTYGKIGLVLVECQEQVWVLKLLLMSCRVMSRGVGTVMLNHIVRLAKETGVKLRAEFIPTDHNRVMYITYKFSGFKEVEQREDILVFENDFTYIYPFPKYLKVNTIDKL
ncbi:MAG: HAD-IIIC family phosphatase [Ruminiclostridium sp.]|nr:HAD-IIIC family phosphatase [Ruminiclostridium sp.]